MELIRDDIMVSVAVITYGQEKYVRKALDSILMQKTNFKYEIVIGDDCSPDNTREILLDYEKNNSNITLILQENNVGATKNSYDVYNKCKGKYIALLEGDDYWTDPYKLQKQVDFLENTDEYIGVSHSFNLIDIDDKFIRKFEDKIFPEKFVTVQSFLKGDFFRLTTTVFRNIFIEGHDKYDVLYKANKMVCDFTLSMILLDLGKVYVLDDCMSVYRTVSKKGENNYNSIKSPLENYSDFIKLIKVIEKHYNYKYDFSHDYIVRSNAALIKTVRYLKFKEFMQTFRLIPTKCKVKTFLYMPAYISKALKKKLITNS